MSGLTKFPGEPLTILELGPASSSIQLNYKFNEEQLLKILTNQQVIDRKIAVISVVGAFERGKSFLLNYCLRYLYATVR